MDREITEKLREWAEKYNDRKYFQEDPIIFPRHFAERMDSGRARLEDAEIAAVFACHFAWGRRAMIVRDCQRLFDEMDWRPYDYVMTGDWRNDATSIHRTVKWCDVAAICARLKEHFTAIGSLETLSQEGFRTKIYGQKADAKAPDKKINMMRRWMVRDDGKVDLGLWKQSDKSSLVIPLDVHVYTQAVETGLTSRKAKDIVTAREITDAFRQIWPDDPCKGDFALFGYGVTGGE